MRAEVRRKMGNCQRCDKEMQIRGGRKYCSKCANIVQVEQRKHRELLAKNKSEGLKTYQEKSEYL